MRYVLMLLLFAVPVSAQSAKVTLHSGSILAGSVSVETWPLQTKWGLLKIPMNEVYGIEVGLHYDGDMKTQIKKHIASLDNDVYTSREISTKALFKFGKYAVPFLNQKMPMTADIRLSPEREKRSLQVLEKILEADLLASQYKSYDTIRTKDGDLRGEILLSELEVTHPDFSTVKVKLSAIMKLQSNFTESMTEVKTDAGWIDTGIHLDWGMTVKLKAEGQIDLWPMTPSQYITGPEGHPNTVGRGSLGKAGMLIAKVGEFGETIQVGASATVRSNRAGHLYLMIVQNPWNGNSSGSYQVQIKGD